MPKIGQPLEWTPYPGNNIVRDITSSGHYILSEQRGGTSATSLSAGITGALARDLLTVTGQILINSGGVVVSQSFLNTLSSAILNNILPNDGDMLVRYSGALTKVDSTYRFNNAPLIYNPVEGNIVSWKNAWSPGDICHEIRLVKNGGSGITSFSHIGLTGYYTYGSLAEDDSATYSASTVFSTNAVSGSSAGLLTAPDIITSRQEPKLTIVHQNQNISNQRTWLGMASTGIAGATLSGGYDPQTLGITCAAFRLSDPLDSFWTAVTCNGTEKQETPLTGVFISATEQYVWHIDYDRIGGKAKFYVYHDNLGTDYGLVAIHTGGIRTGSAIDMGIVTSITSLTTAVKQLNIHSITCTIPYKVRV